MQDIERWGRWPKRRTIGLLDLMDSEDDHAGMQEAQSIVDRLHTRQLYRYCNEFLVPEEHAKALECVPGFVILA